MLTLRAMRHPFRSDDGHIDACGDSRLAKGMAVKGAINSLDLIFSWGLRQKIKSAHWMTYFE
jgi:hypothetical protein